MDQNSNASRDSYFLQEVSDTTNSGFLDPCDMQDLLQSNQHLNLTCYCLHTPLSQKNFGPRKSNLQRRWRSLFSWSSRFDAEIFFRYFHIYGQRLEALRERVAECVRAESGQDVTIKRLSELDEIEEGRSVVVIGTLFKNQVLKPNILKEVGEDNAASNETNDDEKDSLAKFIDDSDELVLEDDLQRARLYFPTDNDQKYDVDQFVSGIVCGIFGYMIPSEQREGGGRFCVKKMFFPAVPEHPNTSQPSKENVRCVALMSGLNLSENTSVAELGSINLVSEFILGECGDMDTQKQNSQFDRIILAGNHLSSDTRDRKILRTAKYLTTGQSARSVNAVNTLDNILEDMASGIEVDIMPGYNDPANQNLPQQPLHLCLFPSKNRNCAIGYRIFL